MTRIDNDGIQSLIALMRSQVPGLANSAATGSMQGAPNPAGRKAAKRSKNDDLAARLARRVKSIDPDSPEARRQAIHVFLETVLLAEFGERLINDPSFQQIVERIHEQMRSNDELLAMMRKVGDALLRR